LAYFESVYVKTVINTTTIIIISVVISIIIFSVGGIYYTKAVGKAKMNPS